MPAIFQLLWRSEWDEVGAAQDDIQVAVPIQVSDIHRQPSAPRRVGKGMRFEIHVFFCSDVFEIDETLFRGLVVIGKIGKSGNIKIPVSVKICGHSLECAV